MNNVGKNSFEFTGITSGTKVLVSAGDGRWEERIFITSILGAWHPYICVSEHDEEEYLNGNAFDVTFWLDLQEIEGGRTIVLPMSPFSVLD